MKLCCTETEISAQMSASARRDMVCRESVDISFAL